MSNFLLFAFISSNFSCPLSTFSSFLFLCLFSFVSFFSFCFFFLRQIPYHSSLKGFQVLFKLFMATDFCSLTHPSTLIPQPFLCFSYIHTHQNTHIHSRWRSTTLPRQYFFPSLSLSLISGVKREREREGERERERFYSYP